MADIPKNTTMTLSMITVVKALAIALIVTNHAYDSTLPLHGGLNILLFISGISLASFAFQENTAHTLRSFKSFLIKIVLTSAIFAFCWNVLALYIGDTVTEIKWSEHLMYSNWLHKSRIALFPIWYIQVIFQIMIFLAAVFWIFDLTPKILQARKKATLIALGMSLTVAAGSYAAYDWTYLADKLPHLLLWNFVLGWVYWAYTEEKSLQIRIFLTALFLASEALIFLFCNAQYGEVRFVNMFFFTLLILWVDKISLPTALARPILIVSQSTFFIFLLHYYAFWILLRVLKSLGYENIAIIPELRLLAGLIIPVFLWVAITALIRTYKKLKRESTMRS